MLWSPDTCEGLPCVLEFDRINTPDRFLRYLRRCRAHSRLGGSELAQAAFDDNVLTNRGKSRVAVELGTDAEISHTITRSERGEITGIELSSRISIDAEVKTRIQSDLDTLDARFTLR